MVDEALKATGGPIQSKERAGEKDALGTKARRQATKGRVNGITFDAGGLIARERNDRRIFSILGTAVQDGDRIIVPATALGQVILPSRYACGG